MATNNQVHVDIVHTQRLEALVQALLNARIVRRPHLGHDVDVLALNVTLGKDLLEGRTDLGLVAVGVGAVDEGVAVLEGKGDGGLDLAWLGLPGSYTRHDEY